MSHQSLKMCFTQIHRHRHNTWHAEASLICGSKTQKCLGCRTRGPEIWPITHGSTPIEAHI